MKRTFAGLAAALAMFVMEIQTATPADACGVKLIVKTPNPRQAVARSSKPSDILLLGAPSHRLQRDLSARGHKVEVAPSTSTAKRGSYAAVMTDQAHYAEAKAKYGNNVFVYKDSATDAQTIEGVVARGPSNAKTNRDVLVAKREREVIRAGGGATGTGGAVKGAGGGNNDAVAGTGAVAVADKPKTEVKPPPAPKPEPPKAEVKTETKVDNTVAVADKPAKPEPKPEKPAKPEKVATTETKQPVEQPAPKPAKVSAAKLSDEMYFGLGSANISRRTAITKAVSWLKADESRSILIEGHADPTGTPEGNMTLSQSRADAVKDAIVGEGIDGSRIEVQAYGDTKLKYGRSDGRNRRVAIQGK